ncbi:MAG TPA: cbb3-type cytochrome c oxidase subunit I [Polyangiaceae bacterium]|nr:cbb3-type cytochrome c oxidase subunit I [Polyangiaceae bacterium]
MTFVCAAILVVSHWTPAGLITHAAYNSVFTVHGALVAMLFPALVLFLSEFGEAPPVWRPRWLPVAAWLALGLEALIVSATLVSSSLSGSGDEDLVSGQWVGIAIIAPCFLVALSVLLRLQATLRARDLALSFAGVVQALGLGLSLPFAFAPALDPLAHPELFSLGHVFTGWVVEATALAAVTAALGEPNGRRGPIMAVVLLALAAVVPRESLAKLLAVLAATVSAGWLLVLSLKRRPVPRAAGESAFAALAALCFLEATGFEQFLCLMSSEIHLHDTYFVVGLFHLRVTTCLSAALAAVYRHRTANERRWFIGSAGLLALVGSQIMGFAMLLVGSRGMPRRYFNYLPEFQAWHQVIAIGGFLLMLGVVIGLSGALRAKSRTIPRLPA